MHTYVHISVFIWTSIPSTIIAEVGTGCYLRGGTTNFSPLFRPQLQAPYFCYDGPIVLFPALRKTQEKRKVSE